MSEYNRIVAKNEQIIKEGKMDRRILAGLLSAAMLLSPANGVMAADLFTSGDAEPAVDAQAAWEAPEPVADAQAVQASLSRYLPQD